MKVEVKETQEFKPIVLTITIESKEELAEMFARHSLPLHIVSEKLKCNVNYHQIMGNMPKSTTDQEFYDYLKLLYKKINPETI